MNQSDFESAYHQFWGVLEADTDLKYFPFPYEICQRVEAGKWWLMGGIGISSDLRSTINILNTWRSKLHQWSIWLKVLEKYDEQEAMEELQFHFLDHLIFFCMFQPSSFRDALAKVVTQAIHQGNLSVGHTEQDRLDEDELDNGQFLLRKKSEKQLRKLGGHWFNARPFIELLTRIDSDEYRKTTLNYRNRASHAIPPNFGWGEVDFVTRTIDPDFNIVEQGDGGVELVTDKERKVVSYALGGTPPLDLRKIYQANSREHEFARQALETYCALLEEIMQAQYAR